jgi:succinoglycan biosynthesis protein ExoA
MPLPQATDPSVTAVLLCRNEVHLIEKCVQSLLVQRAPPGGFEILVVDGMSDDGTRLVLQRLAKDNAGLSILDNPQHITPCGMNIGIRAARGRWIAIMGSHNRYAEDYLLRCHEVATLTGAENVGGAMFSEGSTLLQQAIAASHHSPFSCGGASWHDPSFEGPADTVFGGFYQRGVFDRVGFYDESLVRNQDDELNLRLVRAGGRIWISPRIRSWYHPRPSLSPLFRQYMQYGYWKVRVIQKHKLPASWRHLVPGAFVAVLMLLFLLSALCFPWPVKSFAHFTGQLSALCFISLLSFYLLAVLAASVITAARSEWKLLPVLPLVFPCYHFGYGYGFLRGVWDFVIRRKGAQKNFATLTR